MGLALTAADVAALEGRTEGWIAALQLAALSLQGREDTAAFIAGFAGDDRYIVDYLAEEVLQRQPGHVQQFLLQTSILDRLSGPPSKTDAERLLVVGPELADVLSAIICRVRDSTGTVPCIAAYDRHERVWLPPAPVLFQRRFSTETRRISADVARDLLAGALKNTGLVDPADGGALRYTPHDFRRVIHSSYYQVFSDGNSGDWIGEMLSTFPQPKMNIY